MGSVCRGGWRGGVWRGEDEERECVEGCGGGWRVGSVCGGGEGEERECVERGRVKRGSVWRGGRRNE